MTRVVPPNRPILRGRRLPGLLERMVQVGSSPHDTQDVAETKRIVVGALWVSLIPNTAFIFILLAGGFPLASLSLAGMELLLIGILVTIHLAPHRWAGPIHVLIAGGLVGITVMSVLYGGLAESGTNAIWGFAVILAGVVVFRDWRAVAWTVVYIAVVVSTEAALSGSEGRYDLPDAGIQSAVNLSIVGAFVFLVLLYFVRQRARLQAQSDDLLRNVLPDEIAERLKKSDEMIAEEFEEASILFADVVDFTPMSAEMSPAETVELLNDVFSRFDRMVEKAGLEKIKTIGDEYMVAAGVPRPRSDHAHAIAGLALEMREFVDEHEVLGRHLTFRMGINSGPVVAGIIGTHKFAYDLWGDAVNTASRMESHGESGVIQISAATYELIRHEFDCASKGSIEVKGKGNLEVWHLLGARSGEHQGP